MKRIVVIIPFLVLLLAAGCEKNEGTVTNVPSKLVVLGYYSDDLKSFSETEASDDVVFSGEDILFFNSETGEIKFKEDFSPFSVPWYNRIRFELSGEVLFHAIAASDINSQIFNDLVLYYNVSDKKFYLNDSYPVHIFTEEAKANKEKRASAWVKFLNQLKVEGKLRSK